MMDKIMLLHHISNNSVQRAMLSRVFVRFTTGRCARTKWPEDRTLRDEFQHRKHKNFDSRINQSIPDLPTPRKVKDASLVKIPPRIERGPTDILRALASTIGTDYTAPHYKYHDDPYLIPVSNLGKRSFSLAKEAGRKAAKWIRQEHADLFQHKVASPPVELFYPSLEITDDTPVNEELLLKLINQGHVSDCKKVYGMLKAKDIDVSKESKQQLLELVAYYNETEPLDEELIEERWYRAGTTGRERQKNTWKDNGFADNLFAELEPQDVSAYCAMIRGKAKYFQVEKAWNLYNEAQSKGFLVDTDTINSLIRVVNFARENSDLRWQLVRELLTDMEKSNLRPNQGTLNATLEAISTIGNTRQAKDLAIQTLTEFKRLGIEPSLASYYFVLITYCKERGPISTVLVDIMEEIKGKSFTSQHPKDTFFFITAMDICRNHLQDVELANKVDELLHTANNYDLIGDSFKESIYYRHLLGIKCNSEPFEKFMEFYDKIVPNIYTPEPGITEEILRALELNGSIQFIPRFWSDMVIFEQSLRDNLVTLILQIMANNFPEDIESELAKKFVEIGAKIWTLIESQDPSRGRRTFWTGKMLGDLMIILVKGDAYTEASAIMQKLLKGSPDIVGVPEVQSIKAFLEASIKEANAAMCLASVQYANDCGFADSADMAEEIHEKVKLDSIQLARLNNIIGFDLASGKIPKEESRSSS